MFWEEKIGILKRDFPPTDFRDPFTDWPEILKKIEAKFIIKKGAADHFVNWSGNIKNKTAIRTILRATIYEQIKRLDSNKNYWIVIVDGYLRTPKHLVYDCKINALEALLSFVAGDFYIIDKKYNWLTYFEIDKDRSEVKMFKSGSGPTPFDPQEYGTS